MTEEEKQEVLYVLESRLTKYIAKAKEWFETTAPKIKGTYTDRLSGDIPLYFKSNARKWQSIIPNVSPFCFCFTKDLSISNMLNNDLRITDILEQLCNEGLVIQDMKIVVKNNTHLLGTSQQVIIMFPEDFTDDIDKKAVNISLTLQEALQLLDNETVSRNIRQKISRQLQGYNKYEKMSY